MRPVKIEVPSSERASGLALLYRMNINHLSLFPDLYGSAKHCNTRCRAALKSRNRGAMFSTVPDLSTWLSCTKTPERCTKRPDEVQAEVRPAFEYIDSTNPFIYSTSRPGFKCKTSRNVRSSSAVNTADGIVPGFRRSATAALSVPSTHQIYLLYTVF